MKKGDVIDPKYRGGFFVEAKKKAIQKQKEDAGIVSACS